MVEYLDIHLWKVTGNETWKSEWTGNGWSNRTIASGNPWKRTAPSDDLMCTGYVHCQSFLAPPVPDRTLLMLGFFMLGVIFSFIFHTINFITQNHSERFLYQQNDDWQKANRASGNSNSKAVISVVLTDDLGDSSANVRNRHVVLPSFGKNIYLTDISVLNGTDYRQWEIFNWHISKTYQSRRISANFLTEVVKYF